MSERNYQGFWGMKTGEALEELVDFLFWNKDDWIEFEKWMDLLEKRARKKKQSTPRNTLRDRLKKIIQHRAVETKHSGAQIMVRLSDDGWRFVQARKIRSTTAPCRDGFVIVAFDVPEKFRRARNLLRRFLKQSGFEPLQRSVWVHRAEVGALVVQMVKELDLTPWVTVAQGRMLETHFN